MSKDKYEFMELRSDFKVELHECVGSDDRIRDIARVSTGNDKHVKRGTITRTLSPEELEEYNQQIKARRSIEPKPSPVPSTSALKGFLNSLIKHQHGSPFEHNLLTFRIEVPIFLWREFHRHRIGFSYNEQSGRYMQLLPHFYAPNEERRFLSNKPEGFKPMSPSFTQFHPTPEQDWNNWKEQLASTYHSCYALYKYALSLGLDNGLARIILPVGLYSACYVSCNVRSIVNWLHLRRESDHSHPQWEMDQLAQTIENMFAMAFPITHELWVEHGRGKL